jgi:superfamily II DNA or RNA helicase
MKLRPYQAAAIEAILSRYAAGDQRVMIEMPTGSGKTVILAELAKLFMGHGRILVVAHRDELIRQAAAKIRAIAGITPAIEKAEEFSAENDMHGRPAVIVSSVQTLTSGKDPTRRRMHRFNPREFGLVILDECHHAVADSWVEVAAYYAGGGAKILGVTATSDRADRKRMGAVFEHVAYKYTLPEIISDGYLVPIVQRSVFVEGLDFSRIRPTAGDLNLSDLEAAMTAEEPLHAICHASLEVAAGLPNGALADVRDEEDRVHRVAAMIADRPIRKTLLFTITVSHAERTAEILNRWVPGVAEVIHGGMTKELRADRLAAFARGDLRILANCMVATEGFDEPSIEVVVIARPTKSRALYTQMIGRGTRPAECIAAKLGELETAAERLALIASSPKPHAEILDFVGNAGRHKLVSTVDILGDGCSEEVLAEARRLAEQGPVNTSDAIEKAKENVEKTRREAEEAARLREIEAQMLREQEAARRASLVGTTRYQLSLPVGGMEPTLPSGISPRHVRVLQRAGVPAKVIGQLGQKKAADLSREMIRRHKARLCTYKQGVLLLRNGVSKEQIKTMTKKEASERIGAIAAEKGWRTRK